MYGVSSNEEESGNLVGPEHGVHTCLNKSGVLAGPGFGVNNHTEAPSNLVIGFFILKGHFLR